MTQNVQGPDGRIHRFPDDAKPEEIAAAIKPKGSIVDAIIQGATFGLSDEAQAYGAATGDWIGRQFTGKKGSFGADVDRELAIQRAKLQDLSMVQKIAGGAIGGLVTGPATAVGSIAKQGAVMGGAFGVGAGEGGAKSRIESGIEGALGGYVLGKALPPVLGAAGNIIQSIKNPSAAATRRASDIIAKALKREGIDGPELAARLAASPEGQTIAEAGGEPLQRLARAVASTPGTSGKVAAEVLGKRSAGMGEEVTKAARSTLGDVNAYGAMDALVAKQRAASAPLYESAYQRPMPFTSTLEDILNKPATRKALKQAQEIAANEGNDIPQWFVKLGEKDGKIVAGDIQEVPSTKVWHYVRQALDDQLEKYRNGVTGKLDLDTAGRAIAGIRGALSGEMKALNPELAQADAIFSGVSRSKEAIAQGREFMKRRPEEIAKQMASLNDSEKEFFRLGVAQQIDDRMSDVTRGHSAVSRLADVPTFDEKVRTIFPDDASAQSFIDLLNAKRDQQAFKNATLGGSRTAPLLKDIEGLGTDRLATAIDAARAATGDVGAIQRLGFSMANKWQAGFSEQTRNQIGDVLFSQKLPDIGALTPAPSVPSPVAPGAVGSAVAAAGNALTGESPPPVAPIQPAGEVAPSMVAPADIQEPQIDPADLMQRYGGTGSSSASDLLQRYGGQSAPGEFQFNIDKYLKTSSLDEDQALALFRGQESNGNPNAVAMARGGRLHKGTLQLGRALFDDHARPGESFYQQDDVERVAERAWRSVYQKHGGDLERVAVEWFSGARNVSDGPTPWRYNGTDGHKRVSDYVSDIRRRQDAALADASMNEGKA